MDLSYIRMYYISVLCTRVVCTSYHMATRVLVNSLHVENKLAKDPMGHVITVFYECLECILRVRLVPRLSPRSGQPFCHTLQGNVLQVYVRKSL